jgi:hypothetical protein
MRTCTGRTEACSRVGRNRSVLADCRGSMCDPKLLPVSEEMSIGLVSLPELRAYGVLHPNLLRDASNSLPMPEDGASQKILDLTPLAIGPCNSNASLNDSKSEPWNLASTPSSASDVCSSEILAEALSRLDGRSMICRSGWTGVPLCERI